MVQDRPGLRHWAIDGLDARNPKTALKRVRTILEQLWATRTNEDGSRNRQTCLEWQDTRCPDHTRSGQPAFRPGDSHQTGCRPTQGNFMQERSPGTDSGRYELTKCGLDAHHFDLKWVRTVAIWLFFGA